MYVFVSVYVRVPVCAIEGKGTLDNQILVSHIQLFHLQSIIDHKALF